MEGLFGHVCRSPCFFACQSNLPSKHSICGYNKGARSCHFHVNLTRASETILMQTSSSLGNPLQGQSGINLNHRCTNLLYCKQYTTVNAFKRVTQQGINIQTCNISHNCIMSLTSHHTQSLILRHPQSFPTHGLRMATLLSVTP